MMPQTERGGRLQADLASRRSERGPFIANYNPAGHVGRYGDCVAHREPRVLVQRVERTERPNDRER